MLKRASGTRHLQIVHENNNNNNILPLNISASTNEIIPNTAVVSAATSPVVSHITRSISPATAARSVRRLTLGTKHTANVRNTTQASHAAAIGRQTLQTLRVNRRRGQRIRRRHTRRN